MTRRQTASPTPIPFACFFAASVRKNGGEQALRPSVVAEPDPAIEDDDLAPRRPRLDDDLDLGSPAGLYLSALLRRFSMSSSR